MILAARALLVDPDTWIEGGGLVVEGARVRRLLRSRRAVLRAGGRRREFEGAVLGPGLVDAHAHLDLGALVGRVPARAGFTGWVGRLLQERARLRQRDLERGVRSGAEALLASGTTTLGDIDSTGTSTRLAPSLRLRLVVYRELLDAWDPCRTDAALGLARRLPRPGTRVRAGLSPHAPYTTSPRLLAAARARADRKGLALSIHWSETREEREWLEHGRGPLARILPAAPRRTGLDLLEEAGLLRPRTALVHGNVPGRGEPERLARHGVVLVHCPGTHAFFARPPFPLARYVAAGVTLALGTDSLASNVSLDMRREMALLRAAAPGLAPETVLRMATEGGARALGWEGLGHLRPGACADLVAWRLGADSHGAALEELTAGSPRVTEVLLAGRPALRNEA